ncbi:hypothetical protein CN085_19515 [Sinorhizobium meliloti]|uniref:hypothetical protein n=1 Tax=Rhizobium meliloti TaxID=382 RepID=UPI000FD9E63D|nr:hypothetical protein [Sinorhizobium meliloti]RVP13102.1 hypothetical protein CN085_19515 [Sinorhizobium meliloti]
MTASPITTAYLDLSPDIRSRAEEIAGSNRPVTWPEVMLLVGQAIKAERERAIEDVLGALTAHELYQYRPKAFEGFIEYARTTLKDGYPDDLVEEAEREAME